MTSSPKTRHNSIELKKPALSRDFIDSIHLPTSTSGSSISIRFHAQDPSIKGRIVLQMTWEQGRLTHRKVLENETGRADEGEALLAVIERWKIDALAEKATLTIPFRIKLVGSDDPAFPETGILTGSVRDTSGRPLKDAQIQFKEREVRDLKGPIAHSNREGISVRTLIPIGTWDVSCTLDGYQAKQMTGIKLLVGTHETLHFVLEPIT